jgi:putative colanic acid biosynthesis acetyltransferase WcaF
MLVDIESNRHSRKWHASELVGRALWAAAHPLFRFSPRIFWGWRASLLRMFGAKIGRKVHIYPSARIEIPWNLAVGDYAAIGDRATIYNLGKLSIGSRATISQGAHLCGGTHEYKKTDMALVKAPITIGEAAWVCAEAFVGPHVVIGDYAIVGARAVAMRNVDAWTIVAGNPAKSIGPRARPTAS